jgi:hypothetical protein
MVSLRVESSRESAWCRSEHTARLAKSLRDGRERVAMLGERGERREARAEHPEARAEHREE